MKDGFRPASADDGAGRRYTPQAVASTLVILPLEDIQRDCSESLTFLNKTFKTSSIYTIHSAILVAQEHSYEAILHHLQRLLIDAGHSELGENFLHTLVDNFSDVYNTVLACFNEQYGGYRQAIRMERTVGNDAIVVRVFK